MCRILCVDNLTVSHIDSDVTIITDDISRLRLGIGDLPDFATL